MIVNLISPDGQYDSTFLSNYATIYIKDELGRLPGVAGITYLGQRDYSLRAWLDPQKLASRNLSAMDVVTAISQQNLQVAAGQIGQQPVPVGQQFQLTINTLGRLVEPEQFGDHTEGRGPERCARCRRKQLRLVGRPEPNLIRQRDAFGKVSSLDATSAQTGALPRLALSVARCGPASSWAHGSMTTRLAFHSTCVLRSRSLFINCQAPTLSRQPMASTRR